MYQSFQLISFPYINSPKTWIAVWFFILLGKLIEPTKEKDRLYYLDELGDQNRIENKFPLLYFTESSISNKDMFDFIIFD